METPANRPTVAASARNSRGLPERGWTWDWKLGESLLTFRPQQILIPGYIIAKRYYLLLIKIRLAFDYTEQTFCLDCNVFFKRNSGQDTQICMSIRSLCKNHLRQTGSRIAA